MGYSKLLVIYRIPIFVILSDMVIYRFSVAEPPFTRCAIVLAIVCITMHVPHVYLDGTLMFDELEAH